VFGGRGKGREKQRGEGKARGRGLISKSLCYKRDLITEVTTGKEKQKAGVRPKGTAKSWGGLSGNSKTGQASGRGGGGGSESIREGVQLVRCSL